MLGQQDVLSADRVGRDPHGQHAVSSRQVFERGFTAWASTRGQRFGERGRNIGGGLAEDREQTGHNAGAGNRLAIGAFDLDGARQGLFQNQVIRPPCERVGRDCQAGPVRQEVNAVDENSLERGNFQAELAGGVRSGLRLDRIAVAVNRGGRIEDNSGLSDRFALVVDDLAGRPSTGRSLSE